MEHQEHSGQKVLPITNTRTVQSLIENTQDYTAIVVDDNTQNNSADSPVVDGQENEDGNFFMQNAPLSNSDLVHVLLDNLLRLQNGNSSGSNSPPHNLSLNDHLPNHSAEPSGSWNNSPQSQVNNDQPTYTRDSSDGPYQNIRITSGASPTPISNKDCFNAYHIHFNSFHGVEPAIPEEEDVHHRGTGMKTKQEEHEHSPYFAGSDTDLPTIAKPKVGLAFPRGVKSQIPTSDTPRKHLQMSDPSPSTYNKHSVNDDSLAFASSVLTENDHSNTSISSTWMPQPRGQAAVHPSSPTAGPPESRRESPPIMKSDVNLNHMLFNNSGKFKQGVRALADSTNKLNHSIQSIRTSIRSGTDRSVASLAARSKSNAPAPLKAKTVPVVPFLDMEKKFSQRVESFMHAKLDPSPGLPPLHPLRDPNMTHQRKPDGSLPPVFGVNVYDVGFFDGAGRFTLLFNILMTREENEELLGIEFKTSSFLPLTGVSGAGFRATQFGSNEEYNSFQDNNIMLDKSLSGYKSETDEYKFSFTVRKGIERGTAIALMGNLLHFADFEVVRTHKKYFAAQAIEWYRHAKGDRQYDLTNGDLVFIIGCYKVPSWGYINYYKEKTIKETPAEFLQGLGGRGLYGWKYSLEGLESAQRQSRKGDPTAGPSDQCIGVRFYSIYCDPKAWKSICKEFKS